MLSCQKLPYIIIYKKISSVLSFVFFSTHKCLLIINFYDQVVITAFNYQFSILMTPLTPGIERRQVFRVDQRNMSILTGLSSLQVLGIHERQKKNPVLKYIHHVKFEFFSEDIPADFVMNSSCVLFLSVRYHKIHPSYIERKISSLGKNYRLRVLLVYVDDDDSASSLRFLNKLCFQSEFSLLLSWSDLESARYIETLKEYENKPSSCLKGKYDEEFNPRLLKVFSATKTMNKTDISTLLDVFGNLQGICGASEEQLLLCPGVGEKKARRLHKLLNFPIKSKNESSEPNELLEAKKKRKVIEDEQTPNYCQQDVSNNKASTSH